jgi:hypothetical protein
MGQFGDRKKNRRTIAPRRPSNAGLWAIVLGGTDSSWGYSRAAAGCLGPAEGATFHDDTTCRSLEEERYLIPKW